MSKDTRQVLADELRRVLDEFQRVEEQVERVAAERKRLATIAQRLLMILRVQAPRAAERLLEELGLADLVARLPGIPGRKPIRGAARKAKKAPAAAARVPSRDKATTAPTPLPKGTPVRMLTGKYKGWMGVIRWITVKGSTVSYTVDLNSRTGQKGRNQVRHGSVGSTWEQLPDGIAIRMEAPVEKKARAPKGRKPAREKTVAAPRKKAATRGTAGQAAPDILPKGTTVRLLKGKFQGGTGVIGWTSVKGSTVTYTVYMPGTGKKRDRTQVNQGSLGRSWELVGGPAPAAAKIVPPRGDAPKTVRRRRSADAAVQTPEVVQDAAPPPASPSTSAPAAILPKGTAIRMITGIYLGYTGLVASVQPKPGPKPDAIYTLALKGPGGKKGRTSVKHGSLGRTWTKLG